MSGKLYFSDIWDGYSAHLEELELLCLEELFIKSDHVVHVVLETKSRLFSN